MPCLEEALNSHHNRRGRVFRVRSPNWHKGLVFWFAFAYHSVFRLSQVLCIQAILRDVASVGWKQNYLWFCRLASARSRFLDRRHQASFGSDMCVCFSTPGKRVVFDSANLAPSRRFGRIKQTCMTHLVLTPMPVNSVASSGPI